MRCWITVYCCKNGKKEFAPKSPEEEWDEKFVEGVLKYLTIVEYYLDLLLFGEEEEKEQVVEKKND